MSMSMGMGMGSGMKPSSGNMTSSMKGSMPMPMPMYFSPWQVGGPIQLLWSTWQIQTPWQFALSWLAVAAGAVAFHLCECVILALDKVNLTLLARKAALVNRDDRGDTEVEADDATAENRRDDDDQQKTDAESGESRRRRPGMTYIPRPAGWAVVKLLRSTVAAVRYLLSLMLMLVAMTFNPSLFLALVVGYLAGDYLCYDYRLDRCLSGNPHIAATVPRRKVHSGMDDAVATAVVRAVLLMPAAPTSSRYEQTNDDLRKLPAAAGVRALQYGLWALPRVASLTFFIVLLAWIVQVEGGLGFANPSSVFGWHALCMSFFAVLFTNEGMLAFVAPLLPQLGNRTSYQAIYHSLCHVCALASLILGMVAIVDYKAWSSPNSLVIYPMWVMWSVHSWLGCFTLVLWFLQLAVAGWMQGVAKPRPTAFTRSVHAFLGHCVYAAGLATCASGFMDMQSSDLAQGYAASLLDPAFVAAAGAAVSMSMGGNGTSVADMLGINTGTDDGTTSYRPHSYYSQLACAGTLLLALCGISTALTTTFLPWTKHAKTYADVLRGSGGDAANDGDGDGSAEVAGGAGAEGGQESTWRAGADDEEVGPAPFSSSAAAAAFGTGLSTAARLALQWTPRVLSATFIAVLIAWVSKVEGGFGLKNKVSIFGWHALCMGLFVAVFTNEAVLTFVAPLAPLGAHQGYLVTWHVAMHVLALTSFILGLVAIVSYKAYNNASMYPYWGHAWSAHSWLGCLTLAVWSVQLLLGAATHVVARRLSAPPLAAAGGGGAVYVDTADVAAEKGGAAGPSTGTSRGGSGSGRGRGLLATLHVVLGHLVFALGLAACATGFTDRQSSDLGLADAVYQLAPASLNTDDPAVKAVLRSDGRTDDFVYAGRPGNPYLVDGVAAYKPHSGSAQLACVAAVLLFALGVATNAALRFLPKPVLSRST